MHFSTLKRELKGQRTRSNVSLAIAPESRTSSASQSTSGPCSQPVAAFAVHSLLAKSLPTFKQPPLMNKRKHVDANGAYLFFSPSGISSSSRSKSRCSSTDHAILNVSDLGPRERFGFSQTACTGFSASLCLGEALGRGDGRGPDAFLCERLSLSVFMCGK